MQEAGDVAFAYVQHAELTKNAPSDQAIVLDVVLCDALFKGVSSKGMLLRYDTFIITFILKA